jgi:hypothetical protein
VTDLYHPIWEKWANRLQSSGLGGLAATLLQAGGPLTLVGAQLVYLSQPVFNSLIPDEQLTALAALLEEPAQTEAFIGQLRKENA